MLQRKLREYNRAKTQGDEEAVKKLAREIEQLTRKLADSHSDPAKCVEWMRTADAWHVASDIEREQMLMDVGRVVGWIITSPFLIAGAALYVAGTIAHNILGKALIGGHGWRT